MSSEVALSDVMFCERAQRPCIYLHDLNSYHQEVVTKRALDETADLTPEAVALYEDTLKAWQAGQEQYDCGPEFCAVVRFAIARSFVNAVRLDAYRMGIKILKD